MTIRIKIMICVFLGLHVPLIVLSASALIMDIAEARMILGIVLVSTLVAVVATLVAIYMLFEPEYQRAASSIGE